MDREIKKAFREKVNGTSFPQYVNIENLLHSKKKKMKNWKQNVAIASITVGLIATTLGLTFPASAGSIPVIGDIFRFLDKGRTELHDEVKMNKEEGTGLHQDYKQYSNEINLIQESNGVKFTIHDAIYDGKTVSLTYSIESNQDLGENPFTSDSLKIKGVTALGGTNGIKKVDEHKYVGLVTANNLEANEEDIVNIKWEIDSIKIPDKQKEIKGNWNFEITQKATESKSKLIHSSVEKDGVKVSIEKLSISPMSFIVYYNHEISEKVRNTWDEVYVDLTIKDDLGNSYSGAGNGGKGEGAYMSLSKTFQKINQNATKLIITPRVTLRNHNLYKGEENMVLKDIIVELEK